MQFEDIKYVQTLYEQRNMSRAADELYISQPGLSKIIKRLELEFGTALFVRGKNELTPTKACEIFLEQGSKILDSYQCLKTRIDNLYSPGSGTLKLGLSVLFCKRHFPSIFSVFSQKYPNISLDVSELTSSEFEKALRQKKIELAVFPLPFTDNSGAFTYQTLYTAETLLAVNRHNPLLSSAKPYCAPTDSEAHYELCVELEEFRDAPFILQKPDQRIRQLSDLALREAGIEPRVVFETRFSDIINQMVEHDNGVGFVTPGIERLPNVEYCHINTSILNRTMVVAYLKDTELSDNARLFIRIAQLVCSSQDTP